MKRNYRVQMTLNELEAKLIRALDEANEPNESYTTETGQSVYVAGLVRGVKVYPFRRQPLVELFEYAEGDGLSKHVADYEVDPENEQHLKQLVRFITYGRMPHMEP